MTLISDAHSPDPGDRLPRSGEADRPLRPRGRNWRYSRYVSLMKVLLPSLAALLIGLMVAWPQLTRQDDRFSVGFAKLDPKSVDTLSMVNPRYFGSDDKRQLYTVTADVATQADPSAMVIALESPKADVTLKSGKGVVLNADVGYFRQKDQTLDLMGQVDLYHDDGYEMHTSSARVDLAAGTAQGDQPVQGHGPFGQLDAEGFRMTDKGRLVYFTGHAKAVLKPAQGEKGK